MTQTVQLFDNSQIPIWDSSIFALWSNYIPHFLDYKTHFFLPIFLLKYDMLLIHRKCTSHEKDQHTVALGFFADETKLLLMLISKWKALPRKDFPKETFAQFLFMCTRKVELMKECNSGVIKFGPDFLEDCCKSHYYSFGIVWAHKIKTSGKKASKMRTRLAVIKLWHFIFCFKFPWKNQGASYSPQNSSTDWLTF